MAKSELERLVSLGLISSWEASKVRRGSKDNSHIDTRDYLSGGRGDDTDRGGHDGHGDVRTIDHIDQREFQRPKPGFVADPKQQSANFPTGRNHIDQRKPAGGSWEKPRRETDPRWTARTPSAARARKSSADEYWSDDWFGDQSGNKRQER
jgi:hypothetical protein